MFSFGKVIEFDDDISMYNKYIQAFLTKRWTHKKEIGKIYIYKAPKIKIIRPVDGYHNTLFIQQSYTLNVLFEFNQLKYMKSIGNIDTAYWISTFFEDYEKNMLDAMTEKLLICGRVPLIEDLENYSKVKDKVNFLITKFHMGDHLSPFEREIERMYLLLKQEKYSLNNFQEEVRLIKVRVSLR